MKKILIEIDRKTHHNESNDFTDARYFRCAYITPEVEYQLKALGYVKQVPPPPEPKWEIPKFSYEKQGECEYCYYLNGIEAGLTNDEADCRDIAHVFTLAREAVELLRKFNSSVQWANASFGHSEWGDKFDAFLALVDAGPDGK
jgi:hypothetical protein